MISLAINIRNPFTNKFRNLYSCTYATIVSNKLINLEFYQDSTIVCFNISWTVCQSHAGLDIEIGLLGYCGHFNFCDTRHWNRRLCCWENYKD